KIKKKLKIHKKKKNKIKLYYSNLTSVIPRQLSPIVFEISATVILGFVSNTLGRISLLKIKNAFIGLFNLRSFLLLIAACVGVTAGGTTAGCAGLGGLDGAGCCGYF